LNRQLALLKKSQDFTASEKNTEELYAHLQNGKSLMDEIRYAIGAMQNREETLLAERVAEVDQIRRRDYIVIFIMLLIGVLVRVVSFYLFDRGIVRRIGRLTEYVGEVIKGNPTNYHGSKKTDAVGALEEKIVELVEKTEDKFADPKQ
jgi:methyl-accepting chemotaxis protein